MTDFSESCYLPAFSSWKRNLGLGTILLRQLAFDACRAGWWECDDSWWDPAEQKQGVGNSLRITLHIQLLSPLIFLISNSLQITTLEIKQALGGG